MNRLQKGSLLCLLAALSLGWLSSCKENTIVNANVLPTVDNIHTFQLPDTLSLYTGTVLDDSVIASLNVSPYYIAVGSVNDPYFGRTTAGAYMQFVPPVASYAFTTTIDSAVLVLPYSGFSFGRVSDQFTPHTYSAYRIFDSLAIDSAYYSFRSFNVDRGNPLGSTSVSLQGIRSARTDTPYLRIRLADAFRDELVSSTPNYGVLSDFLRQFRGIYVEQAPSPMPGSGDGALHYFKLDGTSFYTSGAILFYTRDSVVASFGYNPSYTTHTTNIRRDYSGSPAAQLIGSRQDTASVVLLQNEPGAAIDVVIPNIQSIPKSLINRAELLITSTVPISSDTDFAVPTQLFPVGISDTGSYAIADLTPLNAASLAFIDGFRKPVTIGGASYYQYSINFPRELQRAISEGRSYLHLKINGTVLFPGAFRLIAGGRKYPNPELRMKLNIIYSKLN